MVERARGLARVRREDGRPDAVGQVAFEAAVIGQQVQGIGVEHQLYRRLERLFEQAQGFRRSAETGAAGQGLQVGLQQHIGAAQHQFRLLQVDCRRLTVQQADVNAAGAELQGSATGQKSGTDHGLGAPEHPGVAKAALVGVEATGFQAFGKIVATQQPSIRCAFGHAIEPEVGNAHVATVVGAVGRI